MLQRVIAGVVIVGALMYSVGQVNADEQLVEADEAMSRLQALLGEFNAMDTRQFRMIVDSEIENRPEEKKPAVLTVSKGEVVFGSPYRVGSAVAFDMVESIHRTVFELGDGQERKLLRRQQRYLAAKFSIRPVNASSWEFDAVLLAHSNPRVTGKPYLKGTVSWVKDGIKLHGIGTDSAYAAGGKLIPTATYGVIQMTRSGDELVIVDEWQNYDPGSAPDGTTLPFPDFSRPIGVGSKWLSGKGSREFVDE